MILISYFPRLTAWFFHVKTARFVCWHHSLPTFRSEIALSARMSAPSFAGSPRCAFSLTKKVPVPAAILFRSISMAAARVSASGAPTNVAFPSSQIHLVTVFNNDWLSHRYSNGSSIGVSRSARKNAANSDWFELKPSSSRPTLHCCFLFFLLKLSLREGPERFSVTLAQWWRARDSTNLVLRRSPIRFQPKTCQLRFTWIWANRPTSKGSKLLFPVIQQIKSNQLDIVYPAPILHFCLIRHLPLLGPKTHSLQACLSLCPSGNRILSLSIALDIRIFLLILQPLSTKLIFARLPREPNTKHTLSTLCIWCCSVATTLSSALTALCLLSYSSFLLLWLCLLVAVWEDFFSISVKRALLFVLFPRPAPNYPILWLAHLFRPLLLLRFP